MNCTEEQYKTLKENEDVVMGNVDILAKEVANKVSFCKVLVVTEAT